MMLPASTPHAMSPTVIALRRAGVSHDGDRATSQARIPVAEAPAAIAPAMHWTHMRVIVLCYI